MNFRLDYNNNLIDSPESVQKYIQFVIKVNPSIPHGHPKISEGGTPADEIMAVILVGPMSIEAQKRLVITSKRGYVTTERRGPDVYEKSYFAEGVTKKNVRVGIMRAITENPNHIDSVDLYQGKCFIRRFFAVESDLWPMAKYLG